MNVAIATVQSPFVSGGAEYLAQGLLNALRLSGYCVDIVTAPFHFGPAKKVTQSIRYWEKQNFTYFDSNKVDLVICLKFPTYLLNHDNKVLWLLHQHRSVYDLWDLNEKNGHKFNWKDKVNRFEIRRKDNKNIKEIGRRFTISGNVSKRLMKYNQIDSSPLYHPPFFKPSPGSYEPFIFCPSRLEPLKRQSLLLDALSLSKSSIKVVFAGTGSQLEYLKEKAIQLDLNQRVVWLGEISDELMLHHYTNCLAVFFGPFDEDYGYITLEAMQAAKAVITCTDSGGPLEFISDMQTGIIVEPTPDAISSSIDLLATNKKLAKSLGESARSKYKELDISWGNVVEKLI
jgi:glycosyltransferase involved in cell wall biosynthesis